MEKEEKTEELLRLVEACIKLYRRNLINNQAFMAVLGDLYRYLEASKEDNNNGRLKENNKK